MYPLSLFEIYTLFCDDFLCYFAQNKLLLTPIFYVMIVTHSEIIPINIFLRNFTHKILCLWKLWIIFYTSC